jgi:hypothetical protein
MSLKFEIADWKFEVTWDGMLCQPLERGRTKTTKKPATRQTRRDHAGQLSRQSLELAANTINNNPHRKGVTK